jgi:hypothetical protein
MRKITLLLLAILGMAMTTDHEKMITMAEAKDIMGEGLFLGPEAYSKAFKSDIKEIMPIPFSKETLVKMKDLHMMLIYQTDKAPDGTPFSIKKMRELLDGKALDGNRLIGNEAYEVACWHKEQAFYTNATPKPGWKLVTKGLVPHSVANDKIKSLDALPDFIMEVFKDEPLPKEYEMAIKEFESKRPELVKLIDGFYKKNDPKSEQAVSVADWSKETVKAINNLKICRLTMEEPVEIAYRMILYQAQNKERLLESTYVCTKSLEAGGLLLSVGSFDSSGISFLKGAEAIWDDQYLGKVGLSFVRFK